jgi:hypothetical protein
MDETYTNNSNTTEGNLYFVSREQLVVASTAAMQDACCAGIFTVEAVEDFTPTTSCISGYCWTIIAQYSKYGVTTELIHERVATESLILITTTVLTTTEAAILYVAQQVREKTNFYPWIIK